MTRIEALFKADPTLLEPDGVRATARIEWQEIDDDIHILRYLAQKNMIHFICSYSLSRL